jgi:Fur family ferric uptake transcriptional regulator
MSGENQELRNAGLKVTIPRVKILELLEGSSEHHMSAEDIYKKLLDSGDDVGLATVYRVLTQFEAADLVTRHHFEGGRSVFELTSNEHHDHIVCVKCGNVEEFFDEIIENRQKEIAEAAGYVLTDHSHAMYGLCSKCQK